MKQISFLYRYSAKYNLKLIIALICLTFVSASNLIYPLLFKFMVDRFTGSLFPSLSFGTLTVVFIAVFIISTALGYYTHVIMNELGSRLRNDIRVDFYSAIFNKPFSFYRTVNVGDITSRATDDIGKVQPVFSNLVVTVYQNVLFICGCIVLMMLLNPPGAIVIFILIILPLPVILHYSKKIRHLTAESQSLHAKANAMMEESLIGIRDIKSFLLEKFKLEKYRIREEQALRKEVSASKYHAKSNQVIYLILSAALLAIFYFSQSGTNFLTAGDAVAFFFYAYSLTMAFLSMGRAYSGYQNIAGPLTRIIEILDPAKVPAANNLYSGAIKGKIEFRNVSFSYEKNNPVLKQLSFEVKQGAWLLVTGPSGSGKSTIANLMLGFYTPESGEIYVDDLPLINIDENTLRNSIGFVGQEPVLFEGTIKDNITLARSNITEDRIKEILKACMLDEFVSSLPDGIDTNIAERGITLSAGQRSRIAVARAIIFEPVVLILDEANSMLEDKLEKALWQNMLKERKDKTTIIFSHHTKNIPQIYSHIGLDEIRG